MKDDFKLDSDHYYNINEFKEQKDSSGIKIKDFSLLFISIFALVFIGFGGVLLISKINNGGISSPVIESPVEEKDNGAVKKFNDYSEMQDFINEANVNIYGYSENYLGGVNVFEQRADFIMAESSDEIGTWGSVEAPAGVPMNGTFNNALKDIDYSTTNVQIAGVDEGDIVKTDGKYIYALSGSNVVIVNAYPVENSKEVSRIKLDSNPSGIYINNDRLLVYGQNYSYNTQEHKDIFPRNRFLTHSYLKVYDISDKNNPVEKKSYDLEGNLNSSRMIGDYVYFITSSPQFVYDEKFPVPIVIENGEVLSSEKTVVNCNCPDVYYFDIPYQSYNFTSISSLNIMQENGKLNSEVYLLDGYQNNLFVSENNAYITFNKRINKEELVMGIMMEMIKKYIFPEMSEKDREIISKIEKADEDIFSKTEKLGKIMMIISKYQNVFEDKGEDFEKDYKAEYENRIKEKFEDISKELEKTVIHKIEINKGNLKYKTSGEVTGIVLNQFSMDESGGYFRIATTRSRDWSSMSRESAESYSNLYVLDADMKVVGKVEELAEGERIYSVRFMQNRAYLVTFKQTDPLFVIGLDDPTSPEVLGELKVPGFSSYLHPYDETTLIGLGKESDENGSIIGGVKLSLFDVSDVNNPKEIDKYVLGDRSSNSIAINEHKAFLFSKDKNLLVIPVTMKENVKGIEDIAILNEKLNEFISQGMDDKALELALLKLTKPHLKYFNGAAVFNINKKGFELKGKIDHSDESSNRYYGNNSVNRSLYIENVLYSLSNKYLKANWISTLDEAKSIKFN